ncbi:hypothetical protein DNTS_005530 [Danionella cerebrum]|uniref:Tenascin XB n=1 Tax=Danionella cerebrum TaxID=2873325 RepID=A0A553NJV7_9TELE|nr:hypothetical protein DNTS_005530 [Danionella translucida]
MTPHVCWRRVVKFSGILELSDRNSKYCFENQRERERDILQEPLQTGIDRRSISQSAENLSQLEEVVEARLMMILVLVLDSEAQSVKLMMSSSCEEKDLELAADSPLLFTHKIRLMPVYGVGSGSTMDVSGLRERVERLEKDVSELRQKCGEPDGCCLLCTTAGPVTSVCPDDCSDQGQCVNGECVCFTGFTGSDCSIALCMDGCGEHGVCVDGQCVCNRGYQGSDCNVVLCPDECSDHGVCVDGKCVCDAGFSGSDCSTKSCPEDCGEHGVCVDGKCVCDAGFSGSDCSTKSCPEDCGEHGVCVDGKCVCDAGFSGSDCSSKSCPEDCGEHGVCVDGKCVCDAGFSGSDCSTKSCPEDCGEHGVCVDGKCVCDAGFSGSDCSTKSCPEDCGEHGVCVDGKCVCDAGFSGSDCSTKSCPEDCGEHGVCVDGKCVCDAGFSGYYCSTKTCPGNCSGRGRCVRGRCICRRGFAGSDCSQCQSGFTGMNCDTVLVSVSGLGTREITDSSVVVFWTPPAEPFDSYQIIFSSRASKHTRVQGFWGSTIDPDQKLVSSVSGRLSSYTQTGLNSAEEYTVSVAGERDGTMATATTTTFTTLPDAPNDLRVMNVTDSKALLTWRPARANIDLYIITYSPENAPGSVAILKVSGNVFEQQLQDLQESTRYRVKIQSQRGMKNSSSSETEFTTSTGSIRAVESPQDLKASAVTPRTAVLTWKPPAVAITGYKLRYQFDQQNSQELILGPSVTEVKLRKLTPSSSYTAHLWPIRDQQELSSAHTLFTTGNLLFPFPVDCLEELQNGGESGTVEVFPDGRSGEPLSVYCDMDSDGGGWIVFQRRKDGKTSFFRGWKEYSSGFGDLDGEFWLGNTVLHKLTLKAPTELRVDLRDKEQAVYAQYSSFSIDSPKKHFTIRLSGYSGTAGDSLQYHNNRPFSTHDRDPKPFITRCAMSYRGGWWYRNCHEANLNGLYNTFTNHQGVIWTAWKGKDFSIPFTEMKIRTTVRKP